MSVQDVRPDKGVKVKIGGEDHVFRFTMSALATLAEKYGSIGEALKLFEGLEERGMGLKDLVSMAELFAVALQHEDKSIDAQQIMDTIDVGEAVELIAPLMSAYIQAMGQPAKKSEGGENPPKA